jgi:hypothetical protein
MNLNHDLNQKLYSFDKKKKLIRNLFQRFIKISSDFQRSSEQVRISDENRTGSHLRRS